MNMNLETNFGISEDKFKILGNNSEDKKNCALFIVNVNRPYNAE